MFSIFSELRAAQRLAAQQYNVIFFAESRHYFQYLKHLFEAMTALPGIRVAYITADKNDPVLLNKRADVYYLNTTLAGVFPRLKADVMVLTMPDLQQFIFKKSAAVGQYVYVFHALVSTHQQYRSGAFDHYDTILCTGPQQEQEIRESERLYNLPQKKCVGYGYPLLEELQQHCAAVAVDPKKILIAPSWYGQGIFSTCIGPLVDELSKLPFTALIRPHPEFIKRNKKKYNELMEQSRKNPRIQFDESPSVYTHLCSAGHLITDRSGIALEYAFATRRPVLFIDTPPKMQNPALSRFSLQPIEDRIRPQIGISLLPQEISRLGEMLKLLEQDAEPFESMIRQAEAEVVHPASCHQQAIKFVTSLLRL